MEGGAAYVRLEGSDAEAPTPPPPPKKKKKRALGWGRLIRTSRPEWCLMGLGTVCLILGLVSQLALPTLFGQIVDSLHDEARSDAERKKELQVHMVELVVILCLGTVFTGARAYIFNSSGERVVARVRHELFAAMLAQELGWFDECKAGELMNRLSSDTTKLQDGATVNVSMFVRAIMSTCLSVGLLFWTSWRLALVTLGVVPPMILVVSVYARFIQRLAARYQDALANAAVVSEEVLSNVRTVRAFGAEAYENDRYAAAIVGDPTNYGRKKKTKKKTARRRHRTPTLESRDDDIDDGGDDDDGDVAHHRGAREDGTRRREPPRKAADEKKPTDDVSTLELGLRKASAFACFISTATLGGYFAVLGTLYYGALLVISGQLSSGSLIAFVMYVVSIAGSLGMLAGLFSSIAEAVGASQRVFEIIDRPSRIPNDVGSDVLDVSRSTAAAALSFENVAFSYPARPDVQALRGISLVVPPKMRAALVGPSGGGKSTLLSLLVRFYDVADGAVRLDNIDVRRFRPTLLRRNFALVAQEPVLFGATIAENIAYALLARGEPQPDDAAIRACARAAYCADFVEQFPEGYDTLVGERGVRLSGGQKQRVAIARALMAQPRVLLLDEATSALDAESEHHVTLAIAELLKDKTSLQIAHRLSTVIDADVIFLIEHGKLTSQGTHQELLATSPSYQHLVNKQLTNNSSESNLAVR